MVYGCGNKCVKYAVFVVNLLVCIVGAALLAVSLALIFSSDFQNDIVGVITDAGGDGGTFASLSAVFYLTAVVGGLLFLTGFLGCCGAACENTCLLGVFFTIILILFLTELGVGIAALVMQDQLEPNFDNFYTTKVISQYSQNCKDGGNQLVKSWNETQTDLNCCGCNNYRDYYNTSGVLLAQCSDFCPFNYTALPGCCQLVWNELDENIDIVGGVAIGLLVIELLAMIFSCCLCSAIKHKSRYS
jgi:hypothetical protein